MKETGKDWEKLPKKDATAASLVDPESSLPEDLDWFDRGCVKSWGQMGVPGRTTETAQVHPLHFTNSMAQLAREAGVDIIEGAKVSAIRADPNSGVEAVVYHQRHPLPSDGGPDRLREQEVTIDDVTHVVVCAGPWTGKLLPKSGISGPRAHSVVYDVDVSPYAVFSEIKLPDFFVPEHRKKMNQKRAHKALVDPEVYARPFGEVYACGQPSPP